MLFLLAMAQARFEQGAAVLSIDSVLPTATVDVLGVAIPRDRLLLAGLAVVAAGALAALYRFTRFGLATRAAADSETGALLTGLWPDALSAANWALASMLATLATILIAPVTGLAPTTVALLIVPALAAALLGRLGSFGLTVAAGLAIGMVQSATLHVTTTHTWIPGWVPDGGLQQALPFVVILLCVAVAGDRLPTRGERVERGLPPSPLPRHPVAWTLGLGGLALVGLLTLGSAERLGLIVSMTAALLALSVVVLTGYVGQISLAPLAFAGVAGFTMARLSSAGWPPILALVAGVGASLAIGVVTGLPAVRVRGMTLAVATLAAAVAIEELVLRSTALTGGSGAARVPPLRIGPLDLDVAARGDAFPRVAFGGSCWSRWPSPACWSPTCAAARPACAGWRYGATSEPRPPPASTSPAPSSGRSRCRRRWPGSAARWWRCSARSSRPSRSSCCCRCRCWRSPTSGGSPA